MGRVCTKLPSSEHHRPHSLPMHTRLPTTTLPMDGRAFGGSSCWLLVPGERESVGLSPHPPPTVVRRHKTFADARAPTPLYQPGDRVWLSTRDLRLRLPCRKLSPCYIGPFKILRQINEVTYHLQLPPQVPHSCHISCVPAEALLFSPTRSTRAGWAGYPPPEILDEPSVYQVRNILDSRRRGSRLEYFVDWEGYGPEEQSWVTRDDILDPMLLQDLHRTHRDRPAPRGRGRPRRRLRGSEAAPGGGGSVRESQSPPSIAITRSQSPEFWSPAPAVPH